MSVTTCNNTGVAPSLATMDTDDASRSLILGSEVAS